MPAKPLSATEEISLDEIRWVASQFQIETVSEVELFQDRGNINLHTYTVRDHHGNEFLLQKLNSEVFANPNQVMASMKDWIDAQTNYLASGSAPKWTVWEPITLVPTGNGEICLNVKLGSDGSVWRLMSATLWPYSLAGHAFGSSRTIRWSACPNLSSASVGFSSPASTMS